MVELKFSSAVRPVNTTTEQLIFVSNISVLYCHGVMKQNLLEPAAASGGTHQHLCHHSVGDEQRALVRARGGHAAIRDAVQRLDGQDEPWGGPAGKREVCSQLQHKGGEHGVDGQVRAKEGQESVREAQHQRLGKTADREADSHELAAAVLVFQQQKQKAVDYPDTRADNQHLNKGTVAAVERLGAAAAPHL